MAKNATTATPQDYSILLEPVITEKSSSVVGEGETAVFRVDPRASKTQIREAVERIFEVKVAKIRTVNVRGKMKRTFRSVGRRRYSKKAYISLRAGEKFDLIEGV